MCRLYLSGLFIFLMTISYVASDCQYQAKYKEIVCYDVTEDEFESFVENLTDNVFILQLVQSRVQKLTRKMFDNSYMQSISSTFIDGNSIEYIEDGAFDGLKNITSFQISNNHHAWNISMYTFRGATISYMMYFHSELNNIQPGSLYNARNLTTLYIGFAQLTKLAVGTFAGSSLKYLGITGNDLSIARGAFLGLDSLIELDVSLNNLQTLHDNMFDGMPNLIELSLSANNLTELNYEAFKGLQKLRILNLTSNDLTEIDWFQLRKYMPQLMDVYLTGDLSYCNFDERDRRIFCTGVNEVEFISYASNLLFVANSLNLTKCKFDKLTVRMFRVDQLRRIDTMYFYKNSFNEIEPGAFNYLNNLMSFQVVDHFSPWNISIGIFEGLKSLTNILLVNSQLQTIEPGSLYDTPKLSVCNITGSKLTRLDVGTFVGTSLKTLKLHDAYIEYMSPGSFQGLNNLTYLDLDHNKYTYLENRLFDGMRKLLYLNISYNSLTSLNYEAFEGLGNLRTLDLRGTGIKEVDYQELHKYMPELYEVYLDK